MTHEALQPQTALYYENWGEEAVADAQRVNGRILDMRKVGTKGLDRTRWESGTQESMARLWGRNFRNAEMATSRDDCNNQGYSEGVFGNRVHVYGQLARNAQSTTEVQTQLQTNGFMEFSV